MLGYRIPAAWGPSVVHAHSVKTDGEPDSCAGATTAVMPRQATNANVPADDIHALGSSNMSSGVQADNMSHLLLAMTIMLVLHRNRLHITGMTNSFACQRLFSMCMFIFASVPYQLLSHNEQEHALTATIELAYISRRECPY